MSWGGGNSSGPGVKLDQGHKGGDEAWKKNADTTKMSPEQVKSAGVEGSRRPPGQSPGQVLHQRGRLPVSMPVMAIAGAAVTLVIGYSVLYSKKKPEADSMDVARAATNMNKK